VVAMKTAVSSDVTPSTWVNCRTLCTKRQQSSHHSAFTKFLSRTIYPNLQKIQYTLGVTLNPRCIWFSCQQLLCSQLHKNRLLGAGNHWQLNGRNLCQIQHHMKWSAKRGLTKISHLMQYLIVYFWVLILGWCYFMENLPEMKSK